jgi:hypothetical protein
VVLTIEAVNHNLINLITSSPLWQAHEERHHLGIIWSSKSSDRVPAGNGRKSVGITTGIRSISDIVQDLGMCI